MRVLSPRLRFSLALLGAACVASACSGPETREVRRVRIATDKTIEFHFGDGDAIHVSWPTPGAAHTRVHDGQSGYLSHSVYPLYFGLDDAEAIERVEVLWPSGEKQVVSSGIAINAVLEIAEP